MTPEIKTAMFAVGMACAVGGLILSVGDIIAGIIRAGIIRRRKERKEDG